MLTRPLGEDGINNNNCSASMTLAVRVRLAVPAAVLFPHASPVSRYPSAYEAGVSGPVFEL